MIQIRRNIFETNSSSTHSITICTEEQYNKWVNGEALYDTYNEVIIETSALTTDDYMEAESVYNTQKNEYYKDWKDLSDEEKKRYTISVKIKNHNSYKYKTYEDWNCTDLDIYTKLFTTPSGDKMIAFGTYGYDG